MTEGDPLFSAMPSISGKCTEDIKALVPPEVKEQLTALAVLNGQTVSQYVRDLILVHVYGRLHFVRLQHRTHQSGMAERGQD